MTTDLSTVRAAIEGAYRRWERGPDFYNASPTDAILAKLSDPAVMDALARWLVAQEDGPFDVEFPGSSLPVYRQRTRNEP